MGNASYTARQQPVFPVRHSVRRAGSVGCSKDVYCTAAHERYCSAHCLVLSQHTSCGCVFIRDADDFIRVVCRMLAAVPSHDWTGSDRSRVLITARVVVQCSMVGYTAQCCAYATVSQTGWLWIQWSRGRMLHASGFCAELGTCLQGVLITPKG